MNATTITDPITLDEVSAIKWEDLMKVNQPKKISWREVCVLGLIFAPSNMTEEVLETGETERLCYSSELDFNLMNEVGVDLVLWDRIYNGDPTAPKLWPLYFEWHLIGVEWINAIRWSHKTAEGLWHHTRCKKDQDGSWWVFRYHSK